MAVVLALVIGVNIALFTALAWQGVRAARRDPPPRLRTLSWALAAVAGAFVLGAGSRLATLGVRQGWLPGRLGDFLISEWLLLQALAATGLGVAGLVLFHRLAEPLRTADRIATALGDRMPTGGSLADLGLTARELDVLAVLARGRTSDKDIAEDLFISPATAGTHVKNIMRKAGVSSRRDLVLLTLGSPDEAATGSR